MVLTCGVDMLAVCGGLVVGHTWYCGVNMRCGLLVVKKSHDEIIAIHVNTVHGLGLGQTSRP